VNAAGLRARARAAIRRVRRTLRPVRRAARWPRTTWRRFRKRGPRLFFHSPDRAKQAAAARPAALAPDVERALREPHPGVTVHREVVWYPVTQVDSAGRMGDYFHGGLARDGQLLAGANHYHGIADSQALPADYASSFDLDAAITISQPVLYGGLLFNAFPHFMAESLYRLYAYDAYRRVDPFVLFAPMWGIPQYLDRTNYVRQVMDGFGIPVERLLLLDEPAKIEQLILPEQKYGYGFFHRPDAQWMAFARSFRCPTEVPQGLEAAERIYVTRSKVNDAPTDQPPRGTIIGESIFEDYLASQGYTIFHPENHTVFEQLTVYRRAKQIVFSEGGALQLCILLPDLAADVAIVSRRRDPIRNIEVATSCLQGYGKEVTWIDEVVGQYEFGLETSEALAQVDWRAVSEQLRDRGFVHETFAGLSDAELHDVTEAELTRFLQQAATTKRFVRHMMALKLAHPRWVGASHLREPETGEPIWPPHPGTDGAPPQ
jgi:capsular polysaccharide biosynthesis protein